MCKEKTVKLYSSNYISILEGNIKFIEIKQLNSFVNDTSETNCDSCLISNKITRMLSPSDLKLYGSANHSSLLLLLSPVPYYVNIRKNLEGTK